MNTLLRVLCLWVVAFGFTATAHMQYSSHTRIDTSKPGLMNDLDFRGIATVAPAPVYPATSLAKKVSGVAVAAILLDRNGHLQTLNVLQAPDEATGQSVHDALMRWTFRPTNMPMKGKIIFYFTIKGRSGTVASPAEMDPAVAHPNPASKGDDAVNVINEAQLEDMLKSGKPNIVDIQDRSAYQKRHRDGAINIPIDEVWPRAPVELPALVPVVVDCSPEERPSLCRLAGRMLSDFGFEKVSVLVR